MTANSPVLTSSANPSWVGQSVTFTAMLNNATARSPAAGTMSFRDGSAVLGTRAVSAAGIAALSSSSLSVGGHSIYAIYSGDTQLPPGISNTVGQMVSTYPTATTLSSSSNSIFFGQSVTLAADVQSTASSGPVSGAVAFYDGASLLGIAKVYNGTASLTTASLEGGTQIVTAEFARNQTYSASKSNSITVVVTTDFAITADPASRAISSGQATRFSITVSSNSGFSQPVALGCLGLPTGATCNFSPATLQNGVGTSRLLIQLPETQRAKASGGEAGAHSFWSGEVIASLFCGLILIPSGLRGRRLFAMLLLCWCLAISGCGATLLSVPPEKTYTVVVTGTANVANGVVAHSTTITLQVPSSF